jgi:hypothetical protein
LPVAGFALGADHGLGVGELSGDFVGVVGELEKIRSNRSRKFAGLGTITSGGGGGSLTAGAGAEGPGDAQAKSAIASSSNISLSASFGIEKLLLVDGPEKGELLGVLALEVADLLLGDEERGGQSIALGRERCLDRLGDRGGVPPPASQHDAHRAGRGEEVAVGEKTNFGTSNVANVPPVVITTVGIFFDWAWRKQASVSSVVPE